MKKGCACISCCGARLSGSRRPTGETDTRLELQTTPLVTACSGTVKLPVLTMIKVTIVMMMTVPVIMMMMSVFTETILGKCNCNLTNIYDDSGE